MRSWEICDKCPACKYVGFANKFGQKLYTCRIAESEEDDWSYIPEHHWVELPIPKQCKFNFEQTIVSQKLEI